MITRDQLSQLVIWPQGQKAQLSLVEAEHGEALASYVIRGPVKGSDLARMMSPNFYLDVEGAIVVDMNGEVVIGKPIPFETTVVTERAEISLDERLSRLERREKRREKREKRLAEQNAELVRQLAERDSVVDHTGLAESEQEPSAEPEAASAPVEGGTDDVS